MGSGQIKEGLPYKEIMKLLGIKNKRQIQTWMEWYRNGETHRFSQPVGKQYAYGKGLGSFYCLIEIG